MYSTKHGGSGRGRSAAPVKRPTTFQPVRNNPRLSSSGGNRRNSMTSASTGGSGTGGNSSGVDESYKLVSKNPLDFGMIIKLAPLLIDEIKKLEAKGGSVKIKFGRNTDGNVIDVGGKVFNFTWSPETGDLCDIYEEQRSGDNGDGLLVEHGGAWRKLSVTRELDDSVKNHVKMRTVEAQRKSNSRKAIILDPGNPSMKNQMKALAAAEVNSTWKGSYNKKKEPPFKKMKTEPSSAPKPAGKGGFSSSTPSKVRASASPLLSTPEQSGFGLSPCRNNNNVKVHANREDTTLTRYSKENAITPEKEILSRVPVGAVQNKPGSNERFGNRPTDLQSLLIYLLKEKPQGMNLKALEKAIGETIPKSVKQIEPVLKKIAVFQAPGRYVLKPDVELDSFKKSLPESGSSPENNNHHREATASISTFPLKADDVKEFEEPADLNFQPVEDLNSSENIDIEDIDIEHHSPDIISQEKVPENIQGPTVSSESGSGSDSDSDSGSDSRSGSGSSSDSGSDAKSNSKEGSDEEVDIMSDDDKESESKLLQTGTEAQYAHNMVDEKGDGDSHDFERDLFGDNQEADMHSFPDKDGDNYADETAHLFIDHPDHNVHKDKNASKRGSDEKHYDENEHAKRLKSGYWDQPAISGGRTSFSESPFNRSPDGPSEDPYKGTTNQMIGRPVGEVSDYEYEKVDNRDFFGNYTSESPSLIDLNAHAKAPADMDSTFRYSETGPQLNGMFSTQMDSKVKKDTRDEDSYSRNKKPPKNSRSGADKSKRSSSHQKKHGSSVGKNKDVSIDNYKKSPVINGHGPTLRRELSDLEMGELRENVNEGASGAKKRFEKNNSFKKSENKSSSDYWNVDDSKGKPTGIGGSIIPQNLPKKILADDHVDDVTRFNDRPVSRQDHAKSGPQHNKVLETSSKGRHAIGSEGYTDNQRKVSVDAPHKPEKHTVPLTTNDKKRHKSKDVGGKKKDFRQIDSRNSGQKRREMGSNSDDSITSYTKYEKDEPEMKGPVKDLPQYNEYVQEYHEKYDCYKALDKILESYRNEFQRFGRDLDLAKGRDDDRYNKVLEQLMESYHQCGMKHKRLKKIFVVLHHELQHLKKMIRDFAEKQTKG